VRQRLSAGAATERRGYSDWLVIAVLDRLGASTCDNTGIMRRYLEIWGIMLRNSLIRELSFKVNFILWMVVEVLWFCGQIVFFGIIFGQVDRIGVPGVFLRQRL
jgi:hypothetical protein